MKQRLIIFCAIVTTMVLGIISCTKDESMIADFKGTWRAGTSSSAFCGTTMGIHNITAGANNYSLYIDYAIGDDTCQREVLLVGTLSTTEAGNVFSINAQKFIDKCGQEFTVSGSGTIIGKNADTLALTTSVSTIGGTTNCSFKGVK